MMTRSRLLFCTFLMLAIALTFYKVPLASPQGITIIAAYVPGDLPLDDPGSALWQQATAVEVPLSAQNLARPMLLNPSIRSITARALRNDSQFALLVEWTDDTQNDSMVRVQDFRDAVAVQLPLVDYQPFFCMGQLGGGVNIWHWKADWQADLRAREDMETLYPDMYVDTYPFADAPETDALYLPARYVGNLFASDIRHSPVENLISGGFGSLTALPPDGQNVQGYGEWADGRWRVVFGRDLILDDSNVNLSFTPGKVYPLAFAVWDGANQERNGQKSTSQWVSLQVERQPAATTAGRPQPAAVQPPAALAARAPAAIQQPSTEGLFVMGAGLLLGSLLCITPLAGLLAFYKLANRSS